MKLQTCQRHWSSSTNGLFLCARIYLLASDSPERLIQIQKPRTKKTTPSAHPKQPSNQFPIFRWVTPHFITPPSSPVIFLCRKDRAVCYHLHLVPIRLSTRIIMHQFFSLSFSLSMLPPFFLNYLFSKTNIFLS